MAGKKAAKNKAVPTETTPSTRDAREVFLAHLRETANVSASARVALRDRSTLYQWRETDAAFSAAWDDAIDEATDALEQEARRRAIEGDEEYVVSSGQVVRGPDGEFLKTRKRSDALMQMLLKAHRPEKYRERHDVRQSGAIAINITPDDADL
ncbi:hypothetical protein [Acetobacter sicerae]|uniref:hypothetical protein n=1 Tax=Acetobacter sicerae TaxID=85325 RepID=UPI001887BAB0|nr:hypothetical protein [Acetobacter sicerae]